MKKIDLINEFHNRTNLTKKEVEELVNSLINKITSSLKNKEDVKIEGFGTFKISKKKKVQTTNFSKNKREIAKDGLKVKFIFSKKKRGYDEL